MRNEIPVRAARRLLARLERLELAEASEEARDEAQRLLLALHLGRLREGPQAKTSEPQAPCSRSLGAQSYGG